MKQLRLLLLSFFILLAGCTTPIDESPNQPTTPTTIEDIPESERDGPVSVTKVVDGDTIWVDLNGEETKIRYLMVDTPEVYGGTEPYGPEASDYMKELLADERVYLEYDKERLDPYDRTLAYVYLEESGAMVNELLLQEGLAEVVIYEPNDKYEDEFKRLEQQAKDENKGMWSEQ